MSTPVQSPIPQLLKSDIFKTNIAQRMVHAEDAIKFIGMFQTAVQKVPKLMQCTQASITMAAYQLAELNLSPVQSMGHAYLIPYEDKKNGVIECQVQIGWRGLVNLALRDGGVKSIHSAIAYKGDVFKVILGLDQNIIHEPTYESSQSEQDIIAVYAVATLPSGEKIFEVMGKGQIDAIRKQYSKADKFGNSPWSTAYSEMARKTVIKRLCKYLPMSEKTAEAIDEDNKQFEKDITPEEIKPQTTKNPIEQLKKQLMPTVAVIEQSNTQDTGQEGVLDVSQLELMRKVEEGVHFDVIPKDYVDVKLAQYEISSITMLTKTQTAFMYQEIEQKIKDSTGE